MRKHRQSIDAELIDWKDIKDLHEWKGLLVGNGASLAIWEGFKYESLYQKALQDIAHPLSEEDQDVFRSMGETCNFERVLYALWTAKVVCEVLRQDTKIIQQSYENIQSALIEAVHAVHVSWSSELEDTLCKLNETLMSYQSVYSTNYDLLLYWVVMSGDTPSHKDYFWSNGRNFDISNTQISDESRRILYLHGALQFITHPFRGQTSKLTARRENLLSQFDTALLSGEIPLFISEGTAEDKLSAIRRSDYLSFAYEQFATHNNNLVIFGHSLEENDQHLIDAMKHWRNCNAIAISMRRHMSDSNRVIQRKANIKVRIREKLPNTQILFFDAETHPFGDPTLRVTRNGDNNL